MYKFELANIFLPTCSLPRQKKSEVIGLSADQHLSPFFENMSNTEKAGCTLVVLFKINTNVPYKHDHEGL